MSFWFGSKEAEFSKTATSIGRNIFETLVEKQPLKVLCFKLAEYATTRLQSWLQ